MSVNMPFPNSPITEAILDIRCNLPATTEIERLADMHKEIKDQFPSQMTRHLWESGLQVDTTGVPTVISPVGGTVGYQFLASDGKKIVQARLDGFTFNKLKPYENWKTFIEEARKLWGSYRKVAQPLNVTRIAIRYINRIELPLPVKELKDYILTAPEIAPGCPQEMAGFFMRIVLPDLQRQNIAIITETVELPPPDLRYMPFILDLDVFHELLLTPDDPALWEGFASLRETRDTLFFNSITDKTRELFQ